LDFCENISKTLFRPEIPLEALNCPPPLNIASISCIHRFNPT
jgi:hypothetical protein